ncbi:MAG TPA: dihydrodipicolinate synthase family protein [Thermoplasmataceae archaeon]|nr:dihydrodipicolinate synthase family protein [Thermoplasmataceae archaeon]
MRKKVIIPCITPFRDGAIDAEAVQALVDFAEISGYNGLFFGGSTGGFASLSLEQHKEILRIGIDSDHGNLELFAGVTRSSLPETIELVNFSEKLGYENLVSITPFYHKYTNGSIIRFYEEILNNTGSRFFLYNNPPLSGNVLTPEIAQHLKDRYPNVAGIKDSGADLGRFAEFLKVKGLEVYQGKDDLLLESLRMGASGGVCSSANFCSNTAIIKEMDARAETVSKKTAKVIELIRKYETPSIHNFLFRRIILGEDTPRGYINAPFSPLNDGNIIGEFRPYLELPDSLPMRKSSR